MEPTIKKEDIENYLNILSKIPQFAEVENIEELFRYFLNELYIEMPKELNFYMKGLSQDKYDYMSSFYNDKFKEYNINISEYNLPEDLKRKLIFQISRLVQFKGSKEVFNIFKDLLKQYLNDIQFYNIEVIQSTKVKQTEKILIENNFNSFTKKDGTKKYIKDGILEEGLYFIDDDGYIYDIIEEDNSYYVQLNEGTRKLEYNLVPLFTDELTEFKNIRNTDKTHRLSGLNELRSAKFIMQLKQFVNRDRDNKWSETKLYPVKTNIISAEIKTIKDKIDNLTNHIDLIRVYGFTKLQGESFLIKIDNYEVNIPFIDIINLINYIQQKTKNYHRTYNLSNQLRTYVHSKEELPIILDYMDKYNKLDYSNREEMQNFTQEFNSFMYNSNATNITNNNFNNIDSLGDYLKGSLYKINTIDKLITLIENKFDLFYSSDKKLEFINNIKQIIKYKNIKTLDLLIIELQDNYKDELQIILNLSDTLTKYPRLMAIIDNLLTQDNNKKIYFLHSFYNALITSIVDPYNKIFIDDMFSRLFIGTEFSEIYTKPLLKLFEEYFFKIETTFKNITSNLEYYSIKDKFNSISLQDKWCLTIDDGINYNSYGSCNNPGPIFESKELYIDYFISSNSVKEEEFHLYPITLKLFDKDRNVITYKDDLNINLEISINDDLVNPVQIEDFDTLAKDFPINAQITIPKDSSSFNYYIPVKDEDLVEPNELFTIRISKVDLESTRFLNVSYNEEIKEIEIINTDEDPEPEPEPDPEPDPDPEPEPDPIDVSFLIDTPEQLEYDNPEDFKIHIIDDTNSDQDNQVIYELKEDESLEIQLELSFEGDEAVSYLKDVLYLSGSNHNYQFNRLTSEPDSLGTESFNEFLPVNFGDVIEINTKHSGSVLVLDKNNKLYGIGKNNNGELDGKNSGNDVVLDNDYTLKWKLTLLEEDVICIADCSPNCTIIQKSDEKYYCSGLFLDTDREDYLNGYIELKFEVQHSSIIKLRVTHRNIFYLTDSGDFYGLGSSYNGVLLSNDTNYDKEYLLYSDVLDFKIQDDTILLKLSDKWIIWGLNKGVESVTAIDQDAFKFGFPTQTDPGPTSEEHDLIQSLKNVQNPHQDIQNITYDNIKDIFIMNRGLHILLTDRIVYRVYYYDDQQYYELISNINQDIPDNAKFDNNSSSIAYIDIDDPLKKMYVYGGNEFGKLGLSHNHSWEIKPNDHVHKGFIWNGLKQVNNICVGDTNIGVVLEETDLESFNTMYTIGDNSDYAIDIEEDKKEFTEYKTIFPSRIIQYVPSTHFDNKIKGNIAIRENGDMWVWGKQNKNTHSLGVNTSDSAYIVNETDVKKHVIASGVKYFYTRDECTIFQTFKNNILGFGDNTKGQFGTGDTDHLLKPTELSIPIESTDFQINREVGIYLLNGKLFGAGNSYYLPGLDEDSSTFQELTIPEDVKDFWTGRYSTFIRTVSNKLYVTGYNGFGNFGLPAKDTNDEYFIEITPEGIDIEKIKYIRNDSYSTYLMTTDNRLFVTGRNHINQIGLKNSDDSTNIEVFTEILKFNNNEGNNIEKIIDIAIVADIYNYADNDAALLIYEEDEIIKRAVAGGNSNHNLSIDIDGVISNGFIPLDNPTKENKDIIVDNIYLGTHHHTYLIKTSPEIIKTLIIPEISDFDISENTFQGTSESDNPCFGEDGQKVLDELILYKPGFVKSQDKYYFSTTIGKDLIFNIEYIKEQTEEHYNDKNELIKEYLILRIMGIVHNSGIQEERQDDTTVIDEINHWAFDEQNKYKILLK